jgi:hypothetical protein
MSVSPWRQDKTDAMFEPLTATVALLKTYGIGMQDSVLKQLEAGAYTRPPLSST